MNTSSILLRRARANRLAALDRRAQTRAPAAAPTPADTDRALIAPVSALTLPANRNEAPVPVRPQVQFASRRMRMARAG